MNIKESRKNTIITHPSPFVPRKPKHSKDETKNLRFKAVDQYLKQISEQSDVKRRAIEEFHMRRIAAMSYIDIFLRKDEETVRDINRVISYENRAKAEALKRNHVEPSDLIRSGLYRNHLKKSEIPVPSDVCESTASPWIGVWLVSIVFYESEI